MVQQVEFSRLWQWREQLLIKIERIIANGCNLLDHLGLFPYHLVGGRREFVFLDISPEYVDFPLLFDREACVILTDSLVRS